MTVDEVADEWAVGQHRQPLRPSAVQRGPNEQCSQAFALTRRVDFGVDEGDDAGSAPVLGEAYDYPVDRDFVAPALRDIGDGWRDPVDRAAPWWS